MNCNYLYETNKILQEILIEDTANQDLSNVKIKNRKELVDFLKKYIGVTLENDEESVLNKNRNRLYTKIDKNVKTKVLSVLHSLDMQVEEHHQDYYWILFTKRRDGTKRVTK